MQSLPIISKETIGAAFELRLYGSKSSKPFLLLQASYEGCYHCFISHFFAGKSIKTADFKPVSAVFSNADTCHIHAPNRTFRFHARPIPDINSLFSPKPDAQTEATSTNNPPAVNGSTVVDIVDNTALLPKVAAHPGKHQPLTPEDLPSPPEFEHTHIRDHSYAISGKF